MERFSLKHGLISKDLSKKPLIMVSIFGSKSKSSMTKSIPSRRYGRVMAAPVISISSDVSVENVGSSFPRVILIGSISVEVSVAPEVGAAAVASPARVLELDSHSSSKADPSESSPPPVSVAPMISIGPILPAPSAIVTPSSDFPLAPVVAPPGIRQRRAILIRPGEDIPIVLRYTSHHLDRFTSGSSSSHSPLDHSSSGHSISGHSLSRHTPQDTTNADSSTPPRFVHPSLARTLRCSEAYLRWRSAPLSTMYPPTTSESSVGDYSSKSSVRPSRKRCSVEEDIDTDVLEDIEADATAVEVAVDMDVEAGINACIDMEVDVEVDIEDEVKDEVESSERGTMEVGVDMVSGIDIPDAMLMLDAVEHLEQVKEGLQDIYEHVIEIPP
ncbi:hypothetical protein Tco_0645449 [Tanacetum coccineum]